MAAQLFCFPALNSFLLQAAEIMAYYGFSYIYVFNPQNIKGTHLCKTMLGHLFVNLMSSMKNDACQLWMTTFICRFAQAEMTFAVLRSYVSDEYGMSDTEAGNLYAAYGFACTGWSGCQLQRRNKWGREK